MKFLTICLFGLVATSYAGKLNVKRGLLGGQESLDQGYSSGIPSGAQFNAAPLASESTLSAEQSFQPSEPLNNALASQTSFSPSQQQGEQQLAAGRSLDSSYQNQVPQQTYLPAKQIESKEETIRAIHTHSVERVAEPIQVDRTIYKKIAFDRPVPQPYEVIKRIEVPVEKIKEIKVPYNVEKVQTVKVPFEVERIKEIVKTVQVPQPYNVEKINTVVKEIKVPFIVYRDVVKPVAVERFVPQPYEVVKTVERQVPFYVHQKPQITVTQQQVVHQVAQPVLHTVTQQKVLHEVSQPHIVQQPIVQQPFLAQPQLLQQPLAQPQLVHHSELPAAPAFTFPQAGPIVANAALPQPAQW